MSSMVTQHKRNGISIEPPKTLKVLTDNALLKRLKAQLDTRSGEGKLRIISTKYNPSTQIDFSSNDYLGLSRSKTLVKNIESAYQAYMNSQPKGTPLLGSTGSRLLTGHSPLYSETEKYIASFHGYSRALLGNSGWDLNYGLMSCIAGPKTAVYYDELVHNSLVAGTRAGRQSSTTSFRHNSVSDLQSVLESIMPQQQEKVVLVESVYSMDGDICPVLEMLDVAHKFGAMVLVDEAHSTGVIGTRGEGLVAMLGLQDHPSLLGTVHTFGKGVGAHGAALLTNYECLLETLANYSYPLIYSTSLPVHSIVSIRQAYEQMAIASKEREKLAALIFFFREECAKYSIPIMDSITPIQAIQCSGNAAVLKLAQTLQDQGFSCLPIRAPTVPEGGERIRIILHSFNSENELKMLVRAVAEAVDV